jgi:DNA excision repair protein ERCC-2
VETDRFILEIGGRIDGVYRYPDRVIIDEIKTTASELERFADHENPIHWGQAKCYAYLYAVEFALETIVVQLTYYRPDTGEIREFRRTHTVSELEVFFHELMDRYLRWAEAVTDWRRIRDDSLKQLEFPFGDYRPGQREMAVDVYRTIQQGGQVLVQAATGIGKTMAVLFPTAKALGEGLTSKIFYLTARTTGKTAGEKALIEMRNQGARIKSLTLTAKKKICFESEKTCTPEECEFAAGY